MSSPKIRLRHTAVRLLVAAQTMLLVASMVAVAPVAAAGNNALQLNGSSQYATLGTSSDLRSATFTIELWFKRTGTGVTTSTGSGGDTNIIPLITKGRAEGETPAQDVNYFLGIDSATNHLAADFEEGAGGTSPSLNHPVYGSTAMAADSTWHHAAATYDGTTWNLYLDGSVDGTLAVGQPANAATNVPTVVGSSLNTASAAAGYFAGVIDEVRIWNSARSLSQIQADKDTEITSAQPGLLGVWNLNEGTGTSLSDSSGNGKTGAAVGSPIWTAGFVPPAAGNTAPDAPTVNAPTNAGTSVALSPTLDVGVSDVDGGTLTVTYFGRPYASGTYAQIAQHTGVASGGNNTAVWSSLGGGQTYQWYVAVSDGTDTTTGPTWTFHTVASGDPVFVGAGDIADCSRTQDEATGLIVGAVDGNVWTAGDNVYPTGTTLTNYTTCYESGWGGAIKLRTRPVPGNHDWGTSQVPPGSETLAEYNAYFGASATDLSGNSYYSYDIPSSNWHIVNLDTECQLVPGGCDAGSPQELWLRADLTGNSTRNVIAVWHKPRYSSGVTNYTALQAMYDDFYEFGVDVLLEGHDHIYERMTPINAAGVADPVYGIRQFTVGTGGASLQSCPGTPLPTSDVCNSNTYGVMKFTLHASSYDWQFLPIDGSTFTDSGTGTVHGAPGGPATNTGLQLGTSSYVTLTNPSNKLGLGQFTIETWFKRTGVGTPNSTGTGGITIVPLVTHGAPEAENSNVDANWILGINTTGNVLAADFEANPGGQNYPVSGSTTITNDVWHHAAATYDGTTWHLYLDGNLQTLTCPTTCSPGAAPRSDSIQGIGLGAMITSGGTALGRFDGVIDEVRVWDHARTGPEILADKDVELTSGTGLVARWGLNDASGTSVGDSMPTPANGTITGTGYTWVAGFVPPVPDPAPGAPIDLAASASSAGISLTWDANSELDLAGYNVYRSTTPGVSTGGSPINAALLTSPSFLDSQVAGGMTYYYVVTAVDTASQKSDASNEVSAVAVGSGLQLGTSSYVTLTNPSNKLGLGQFTIETWFKRTGVGTPNSTGTGGITIVPLVTHGAPEAENSNVDANWILGINTTGNVLAADFEANPGGQNYPVSGSTTITNDVWHHAAATYDGTTWHLYLDGNLQTLTCPTTCSPGAAPRSDSIQGIGLGAMITSGGTALGRFDGVIDEVRVWDHARTGPEILADKDVELTSGTGLVARWGLNDASGTSVGDSMPTPANGTITGTGYTWVAGAPVGAPASNSAPDAPTLNSPSDAATGVSTSPTLEVGVSDPDGDPLTVTYFGRPYASGNFVQIAQNTGVVSGTSTTTPWSDLGAGQEFEWYVTVDDGTAAAVTGPTWTFHTTPSTDPVFVGVGDIASCAVTDDTATGNIIQGIEGNVFTTGDNVYDFGTALEYANCYGTTPWGSPSVKNRTRPIPGNHDWGTGGPETLTDYFNYFGANANAGGSSYYSYDIPSSNWHIVNLDSECQLVPGGCGSGSAQELWLKSDLAANSTKNVIALWHRPRYSSGITNYQALQPLWDDLYAGGVDILLDGHDHIYEVTAPMKSGATPADPPVADPLYGIQQFTVGMGGEEHHAYGASVLPTSLVRNNTDFGIFKLTLHATTYDWVFLPIAGSTFTDSGTGTVHAAPTPPPSSFTLSGSVTAAGTGVVDAWVYAFDAGTSAYVTSTASVTGGAYSLVVPPGSYKIYVQPRNGTNPDQWYGGATPTVVPVSADTPGVDIALAGPTSFTLSGSVTAAGTGVVDAWVYAFDAGTSAYVTSTASVTGGAYSLVVPPGSYKIYVQPRNGTNPDQWYGGATPTVVPVSADTPGVDIALAGPTSFTLSGSVTAAGTGVVDAWVYAFDAGTSAYVTSTASVTGGAYSLVVPPGSYKIYVQPRNGTNPDQWYGGATPTVVPVSADTPGVDIALAGPTSFTLSGSVTAAGTGVVDAWVYAFDAGTSAYVTSTASVTGGAYSLVVPPGSYKIYVQPRNGTNPDQWYGGATPTVVPVSADTPGVDIALAGP